MKKQKHNRKKLHHFTNTALQNTYLNLVLGGEKKNNCNVRWRHWI